MKIKVINFSKIFLALLAVISFSACENDDLIPEFTLQEASEQVAFLNSVSDQYLLSSETGDNIAERFVWSKPDFGVQTEISYEVEWAIDQSFTSVIGSSGAINDQNFAVTVKALMDIALDEQYLGLDTDPNTEDPGNTGVIYFRVKAFVGTGQGEDATESISDTIALNIFLIEDVAGGTGIEISPWGVVGSGYNDWGNAGPDGLFYTTSQPGVIVSYVTLIDGQIKFRTDNDWSSGDDLGDANADGILDRDPDNNINVTAGDYRITIDTNDNSYTIEPYSWGIIGSGYNDWGNAGPDAKMYYDYTTDTFKVSLQLVDGEIKFRTNNDWSSGDDLGDAGNDGILDRDPDNNIPVTAGHYLVTVNFNTNEYSIVEDDVWGIVGSGYNDWGNAGPDFALTEIQENILYGDIVTLIDGEIKFRTNNDWSSGDDLGDAGSDGFLDRDPDNNIAVTAGLYRVRIDLNDNSYQLNKIQ